MAFVIAGACTKDADCVELCPVDCIHPRRDEPDYHKAKTLHIDPNVCIHCGSCFRVCGAKAVFPQDALPRKWSRHEKRNADYFQLAAQGG